MSFDVYAFDLFAAPHDRSDFLDWVQRSFRGIDGPLTMDVTRLTPALRAWHADMARTFPGAGDPNRAELDTPQALRNASYCTAQNIIQASFDWEASAPALYRAKHAARTHAVGLFEASSVSAAVWMLSSRGRWEVIHRADERGFG